MLEIGKVYRLSRKEKSPDVIEVDGFKTRKQKRIYGAN